MNDATSRDSSIGRYLCEVCYDAMTDQELSGADSPTGLAMAMCETCQGLRQVERWVCGGTWDEAQGFLREKHLEGVLRGWQPKIIIDAASLRGLEKPVVYLVGAYENRANWQEIQAALWACHAQCYFG